MSSTVFNVSPFAGEVQPVECAQRCAHGSSALTVALPQNNACPNRDVNLPKADILAGHQYGPTIIAHIEAGDRDERKADQHYRSAGLLLAEAKQCVPNFRAFLKDQCNGLSPSRAYQLIRIATNETSVDAERRRSRESMRKHRAKRAVGDAKIAKPPRKNSPEWYLAEFKAACGAYFPGMNDETLAEAKTYVAMYTV